MFFRPKEHHVFFDFGHRFSKIAYVIKQNKQYQLLRFNLIPTPDHLLRGEIPANPLIFKELVYELLNFVPEKNHKHCQFHLTSPDSHTILKKINLPHPLPKDLDQHMIYESEQLSPYPIQDAVMDYARLDHDPVFKNAQSEKQCPLLITMAKKSLVHPYIALFKELDLSIDVATPSSIGLMNIGLHLMRTHMGLKRLVLAHLGDSATLLLYLSPETIRFCYHPHGFGEIIQQTMLHCDLKTTEGRYFAEHLDQKDIPDIFLSSFSNHLTRFSEQLGHAIVRISESKPKDRISVLLSGGPSQISSLHKCFQRFTELNIQNLNFEHHLMRNHIVLGQNVNRNALATYGPHFLGFLETKGL